MRDETTEAVHLDLQRFRNLWPIPSCSVMSPKFGDALDPTSVRFARSCQEQEERSDDRLVVWSC